MDQMCKNCETVELIEPGGSESGLVCPQCGLFEQGSNITVGPAPTVDEGLVYHNPEMDCVVAGGRIRYTVKNKKIYQSEQIEFYTEKLDFAVQRYSLDSSTKTSIMEMFTKICFTKLNGLHQTKKLRYLLACTQVCLRDVGIQVLMAHLCGDFGLPVPGQIKINHEVQEMFGNTLKADTYEGELMRLISAYPSVNQEKLMEKLPKILDLIDACSFSIGRDRDIVAAHVAYLVVISEEECTVPRTPFKAFLRDNKIKLRRGSMKELAARLIILIEKMPTIPSHREVNFRNFHIYLKSAIDHHKFIVRRVIADEEKKSAAAPSSPSACPPTSLVNTPRGYALSQIKKMKRKHEDCENDEVGGRKQFKRIAPMCEELTDDDLLGEDISRFVVPKQISEFRDQFWTAYTEGDNEESK